MTWAAIKAFFSKLWPWLAGAALAVLPILGFVSERKRRKAVEGKLAAERAAATAKVTDLVAQHEAKMAAEGERAAHAAAEAADKAAAQERYDAEIRHAAELERRRAEAAAAGDLDLEGNLRIDGGA